MSIVVDSDEEDVFEEEDLEESWTEQSADIRDSKGRQLFDAKDGDEVGLDSTVEHLRIKGKLLLNYICNFHVLSHLLLIHICKFHWNLTTNASHRAIRFPS